MRDIYCNMSIMKINPEIFIRIAKQINTLESHEALYMLRCHYNKVLQQAPSKLPNFGTNDRHMLHQILCHVQNNRTEPAPVCFSPILYEGLTTF